MNKLGRNLFKIRQRKGMTQEQVAELADTTVNYVSKIERGVATNISARILLNLASSLDVTVDELVHGNNNNTEQLPKNLKALVTHLMKLPTDQAEQYCHLFLEIIKLGKK